MSGIIPAYAGSTFRGRRTPARRRDHPRIRGEHTYTDGHTDTAPGSSPHTRGALQVSPILHLIPGIIPAYAGSTCAFRHQWNRVWDHPRIRGEHPSRRLRKGGRQGSSPHTRGARVHVKSESVKSGIIPAYAGSTGRSACIRPAGRDHPRIRGEHRRRRVDARRAAGIIPAYAGSTSAARGRSTRRRDHPRIRGEHWSCEPTMVAKVGSSPHTRGAPARPALRRAG